MRMPPSSTRCASQTWDDARDAWACAQDGLPCPEGRTLCNCPRIRNTALPCPSCMDSGGAPSPRLMRDRRGDKDLLACPACGYAALPGACAADLLAASRSAPCDGQG